MRGLRLALVGRCVGVVRGESETAAACFGGVDLRLHVGAHALGVQRALAFGGQFLFLLASTFERGLDDRAFLRFGVVRCGRGRWRRGGGLRRFGSLSSGVPLAGSPRCSTRFGGFALACETRFAPVMALARGVGLRSGSMRPSRSLRR